MTAQYWYGPAGPGPGSLLVLPTGTTTPTPLPSSRPMPGALTPAAPLSVVQINTTDPDTLTRTTPAAAGQVTSQGGSGAVPWSFPPFNTSNAPTTSPQSSSSTGGVSKSGLVVGLFVLAVAAAGLWWVSKKGPKGKGRRKL